MERCNSMYCLNEGVFSCVCNYKMRLCEIHFNQNNCRSNTRLNHTTIYMPLLIEDLFQKYNQILQNLERKQNIVIYKGKILADILSNEISFQISQIQSQRQKIKKIMSEKNLTHEKLEDFERFSEIVNKEFDVNEVTKIIRNSLSNIEEPNHTPRIENYDYTKRSSGFSTSYLCSDIKSLNESYKSSIYDSQLRKSETEYENSKLLSPFNKVNKESHLTKVNKPEPKILFNDLSEAIKILAVNYGLIIQKDFFSINCIEITTDKKYAICGSEDKAIRIWNLNNLEQFILRSHEAAVISIAATTDSNYVVSGSRDTTIMIWDLHTKNWEGVLQGHTGWVTSLVITCDNKYVISGSHDKTVIMWHLENRSKICVFKTHWYKIVYVGVTNDDKYAISRGENGTIERHEIYKFKLSE
jgi:WD40 repeat protein